uniref:Cyclin T2a n=1 Tax=Iconisemion striatum TaxID=60296 RepID=A0A1A7WCX4_9TELE
MAVCRGSSSKWYFTREQLENTPSRRSGVDPDRELSYRQQAANLIQDMGQRLNVSQLTINTSIVYMHRFYMQHSFSKFHRNTISPTTLFLAAKVEEQPRKLEHVIKVAHACLNSQEPPLDTKSNYKPTVIACVCIHLACKWSHWEIPVSTDRKHWWEYVDSSVTLELLDELTNEFLQILEKTPSRLKRIRNWRATQAAKKPKIENMQQEDNSFPGPSMLQDHSDVSLPGAPSSNPSFSKAGAAFPVPMPGHSRGAPLSLDAMAASYNPASHNEWPQGDQSQAGYPSTCVKEEPLSIPIQESMLSLQTSTSSLLQHPPPYKTEKTVDLNLVKQEPKGAGGSGLGKQNPTLQSPYLPSALPLYPQPSVQKLSLDKYREKHSAELTVPVQKQWLEHLGGVLDCDMKGDLISPNAPSKITQVDHRKHAQSHLTSYGGNITASPVKIKASSSSASGQDRRHHGEKRDKGSFKVRLAVPGSSGSSLTEKIGQPSKDELKMKIKMSSSERHSSSDEGMSANNKNKHSSPLVSKEKHRGAEYNLHRSHKHSHPTTHSGNGRGGPEAPGGGVALLRGPPGLVGMEGLGQLSNPLTSSSSRKRMYHETSHNHHPSSSSSSKVSKISKGGAVAAAGGLRTSQQFPPSESQHEVGEQRH